MPELNHPDRRTVQPREADPERSEADLLEGCRRGDPGAFEELVRRHQRQVYAVAFRFLQNRLEAQEIVQEVFVRVHRALPQFRGGARLATWLYRITMNACLDSRRRLTVRREVPLDVAASEVALDADPLVRAASREFAERVAAALHELPPRQRATLVLRLYEDLSLQEIADVLGSPLGTVKANYHHALTKLRRTLGDLAERLRHEEEPGG